MYLQGDKYLGTKEQIKFDLKVELMSVLFGSWKNVHNM